LGLEGYFEEKFGKEVIQARTLATRKVFWIGAGFGFIEGVGYFSKGIAEYDCANDSFDVLVWRTFGQSRKVYRE
jgi:hypothetical protein